MGIVAFAGSAQILVPPTDDRDRLHHAIDGFTTSVGTAIGNGVLTSIDALARVNPQIAPSTVKLSGSERSRDRFASKYVPDVVVLLTDGAATTGVDPRAAARQAADRGVRVFTIGFGTAHPSMLVVHRQPSSAATRSTPTAAGGGGGILIPGGGGPGGPRRRGNFLEIDEPTLKAIARTTGGSYAACCQRVAAQPGVRRPAPARGEGAGGRRADRLRRRRRRAAGDRRARHVPVVEPGRLRGVGISSLRSGDSRLEEAVTGIATQVAPIKIGQFWRPYVVTMTR